MGFKNVAIAGATGHIGKPILEALVAAGHFTITVLTRGVGSSNAALPASVKAVEVDYDDPQSLVAALQGQEAVVSALSSGSGPQQLALIEAAVHAGVARVLPSEFGSDTSNPRAAQLAVFGGKKKMEQRVEALAAAGDLSYTYVMNGPFLDFCLAAGLFGLDLKQKRLTYLDGGHAKFTTTTRAAVAKAVVGVLLHPEETRNRAVMVQEAVVSQKDLLGFAKQALGDEGWTEVDGGSTEDLEASCTEKLGQGHKDMAIFMGLLQCAILRDGYGGLFPAAKLDNKLLGVAELKETDIVEVVRSVGGA